MTQSKKYKISTIINKKLIVFDLDGTLTESKSNLDNEMSLLICKLLRVRRVAVIGGGSYNQFKRQFISKLKCSNEFLKKRLFIFPTSGATFYKYKNHSWKNVYQLLLNDNETKKIMDSFNQTFIKLNYKNPKKIYGKVIENRKSQITLSAIGQKAPVEEKKKWNKINNKARMKMKNIMEKKLPEFDVKIGGLTSIDITRKGINKGYGIRQIIKHLNVTKKNIIFIGDAIYKGGNDYPAKLEGVYTINVSGPKETKKIIGILIHNII